MNIASSGLELIKTFEGLELNAYKDSVDVPTIGYGHTKGVKMGQVITTDQAEQFLMKDVEKGEDAVNKLIKVPLNQNQFDALVSFTFNLGRGNFRKSTLRKVLNAGRYVEVPSQLTRWIYAGGEPLKGLLRRRQAEANLFTAFDEVAVAADNSVFPEPEPASSAPSVMPKKVQPGNIKSLLKSRTVAGTGTAAVATGAIAKEVFDKREQIRDQVSNVSGVDTSIWLYILFGIILISLLFILYSRIDDHRQGRR